MSLDSRQDINEQSETLSSGALLSSPLADPPDFPALLANARSGDAAARERLFSLSRAYLVHSAEGEVASWLRPKNDASDLVQVSMLEAHRAFASFQGETFGQWLAFLKKILQRNATDAVRHYGAAKRQAGKEIALHSPTENASSMGGPQLAAGGETPSIAYIQHERSERLLFALGQLSEDHQEVIRLRNLQQLPFDEVAQRMGRTRPAVQMLWMRALKSLQETLQQTDPSLGN